MEITTSAMTGRVPVFVIRLNGKLDGSSYQSLIDHAQKLFAEGARNFILDMSDVSFVSSAGLVGIHTVALLARGEKVIESETGWNAIHSMDRNRSKGKSANVKLSGPQERVNEIFELSGFNLMFDIYSDLQAALDSF